MEMVGSGCGRTHSLLLLGLKQAQRIACRAVELFAQLYERDAMCSIFDADECSVLLPIDVKHPLFDRLIRRFLALQRYRADVFCCDAGARFRCWQPVLCFRRVATRTVVGSW